MLFVPVICFLLYSQVCLRHNSRFALGFWLFPWGAIISLYFFYAVLKNELFPSHLNFNLNQPPVGHVALLYTVSQQLHRSQPRTLDRHTLFCTASLEGWLPTYTFLRVACMAASLAN